MATKWLRKKQVRARYGDACDKTVERMVKDERLPAPEFPFGNRIPAWREDVLDAHDKAVVLAPRPAPKTKKAKAGAGTVAA